MDTAAIQLPEPRTPLYPLIQQRVAEAARPLVERLQAWRMMNAQGLRTTNRSLSSRITCSRKSRRRSAKISSRFAQSSGGLPKKQWKKIQPEIDGLYKAWWEHLWKSGDNVQLLRQILRHCLKDRITVTPDLERKVFTFKGELINGQFIEGSIAKEFKPRRRSASASADR